MRRKGFIHIPILVVLITVVAVGTAILASQNPNQDVKGTLIAHDEHDESDDDSDTHEGAKIKTETKEDKQKTEIRFGESEKVKTKVDVYSGGVKVIYFLLNQLTRLFTFHF